MKHSPSTAKRALVIVLAIFAACTFGLVPLMEVGSPFNMLTFAPVLFCFGMIGAEVLLLAIWGALGPGPPWLRMVRSFGTGLVLYGMGILGLVVEVLRHNRSLHDDDWEGFAFVFLLLPLVFLAIQSPLWLVRLLFRWDIALIQPPEEMSPVRSVTIRDMLVATGVVAGALASARFAGSLWQSNGSSPDPVFWAVMATLLAYFGGISLVSSPPIVFATLRARRPGFATLAIAIYCAAWLVVVFGIVRFFEGRWPRLFDVVGISTVIVTFAAATTTTLLVVRQLGFRLRWGREAGKPFGNAA